VKYQEEQTSMYYYVHFFNEKYIWVFENLEENRIFKATFSFAFENLQIEGEAADAHQWKIEVEPKQTVIKSVVRIDPT